MNKIFLLAGLLALSLAPEMAYAGLSEFSSPLQKVVDTITGPVGRIVAIIGIAICGFILAFKREEISGSLQMLVNVVFAISFIAFSSSLVSSLFSGMSSSGAII